jgi:hypothetical protein
MNLIKYPTLLLLTLPLVFNSCLDKDVEETPKEAPTCMLAKISDEDGEYNKFEFDDKHRMVKFLESNMDKEKLVQAFIYTADKIISVEYGVYSGDPSQANDTTFYTLVNGRATSSIRSHNYDDGFFKTFYSEKCSYEYNAEGYLAKTTKISKTTSPDPSYEPTNYTATYTYKYIDGNVISMENVASYGYSVTETYEYYLDKPVLLPGFGQNLVDELINPAAKNLLKKITTTEDAEVRTEDFTYIFNAEGLPTTMGVVTRSAGSSNTDISKETLEYKCDN